MAAVAGGTFTMGCNTSPAGECQDNERPAHSVTVPAFEIDRTEVTVAAWQVWHAADPVPDRTPGTTAGCTWRVVSGQNLPINCVTWIQARSYCYSLDKRLCSEAEWEFAARGGGTRKYPWGDEPPACERAHYLGCAPDRPVQVARHPATANGLWDMAGNVREWVDDDWHGTYDRAPADGSSWHGSPRDTGDRTIRGGHYAGGASGLRATVRMGMMYGAGGAFLGVRCCRSGK
jgi:formylglycine-generating enzyme required for sulfatase activity